MNGIEAVSNVRVSAEARESQRRNEEFQKRELWRQKRKDDQTYEIQSSSTIESGWEKSKTNLFPHSLKGVRLNQGLF